MMVHESRRWSRILPASLAVYVLAQFTGTHWPHPTPGGGSGWDKVAHFSAYTGLALLLAATLAVRGWPVRRLIPVVIAAAALFGAFDEITQILVPNRDCDIWDWLADVCGALTGVAIFVVGRG